MDKKRDGRSDLIAYMTRDIMRAICVYKDDIQDEIVSRVFLMTRSRLQKEKKAATGVNGKGVII